MILSFGRTNTPITKHIKYINDLLLLNSVEKTMLYDIHYDYEVFTDDDHGEY